MGKGKLKKNEGGGGGDRPPTEPAAPSTSSSTKGSSGNRRSYENEELERATVQQYRRKWINKGVDRCMIIYRLNAWKRRREAEDEDTGVDPDNPLEVLGSYKGRMDFDINADDEGSYHILSRPFHPRLSGLTKAGPKPERITCDHEKVSFDHCSVYPLKKNKEHSWIEDNSEHGTFVNRRRIPKGIKCKLRDGDIISLGSPRHSKGLWGDPKNKRGFVFKVKFFKRRDDEQGDQRRGPDDISSPVFLALNNNLVLGEILNYLSHKDLKTARLVNKFWKGMTDPKIWSRSVLEIRGKSYRLRVPWKIYFAHILLMTEKYNFPNWRINYEEKLLDEIVELIQNKGHLVQNLQLKNYTSQNFNDQFMSILRSLPHVKSLHLNLSINVFAKRNLRNDSISITQAEDTFPAVKNLCLHVEDSDLDLMKDKDKDMIVHLAKIFPNVEKLTTKRTLGNILLPISMQNLWPAGLKDIGGCITDGGEHVYGILYALPHKLRQLELHKIPSLKNPSEITSFENMLKTHAPTLEHLVLRFNPNIKYKQKCYSEQQDIKPIVRFPTFPKLKTLEILSKEQEDLNFQIMFPSSGSGSIFYEKDFPVIKELRLLPINAYRWNCWHPSNMGNYWDFYCDFNSQDILDVFIPRGSDSASRTMTWIEFRLEGNIRKKGNQWYVEFVERFRKMFPHVHHPHLKEKTVMEDRTKVSDSEESEYSEEEDNEEGPEEPATPPRDSEESESESSQEEEESESE